MRAFRLAALHIERTAGNVYNIGGGPANSVSIWHELQPLLESHAKRPLYVARDDWRPGDQPVFVSDTRKAARDFGWQPQVAIEDGLQRLWDWALDLSDIPAKVEPARKPARLRLPVALAGPSA